MLAFHFALADSTFDSVLYCMRLLSVGRFGKSETTFHSEIVSLANLRLT